MITYSGLSYFLYKSTRGIFFQFRSSTIIIGFGIYGTKYIKSKNSSLLLTIPSLIEFKRKRNLFNGKIFGFLKPSYIWKPLSLEKIEFDFTIKLNVLIFYKVGMHFAIEILGLCNKSSFEVCEKLFRSGRKWSFLVLFDLQSHSSVKRKKIGKNLNF